MSESTAFNIAALEVEMSRTAAGPKSQIVARAVAPKTTARPVAEPPHEAVAPAMPDRPQAAALYISAVVLGMVAGVSLRTGVGARENCSPIGMHLPALSAGRWNAAAATTRL